MRVDFDSIPENRCKAKERLEYLARRTRVRELCPRPISEKRRFWIIREHLVDNIQSAMGIDRHCASKIAWEIVDSLSDMERTERDLDSMARVSGFLERSGKCLRSLLQIGRSSRTGLTYYPVIHILHIWKLSPSPHWWERTLFKIHKRASAILEPWGLKPSKHAMAILIYQLCHKGKPRSTRIGKIALGVAALTLIQYFGDWYEWYYFTLSGAIKPTAKDYQDQRTLPVCRWWQVIAEYSIGTKHSGSNGLIRWDYHVVCEDFPYDILLRTNGVFLRRVGGNEIPLPKSFAIPLRKDESATARIDAAKNRSIVELLMV